MKIDNARIAKAAAHATENFWGEFASHFPEVTTGDMSPEDCVAFDWAVTKATSAWVTANTPNTIKLECYTCCLDRIQNVRQDKLGVITLRCQKCRCERPLNLKDLQERP